jgi:non-homologous end joining protein Ku
LLAGSDGKLSQTIHAAERFFSNGGIYHLEAEKAGDKAYVLLRDALVESGKIAIARVVIRTRQHLAAVKPQKKRALARIMIDFRRDRFL